MRYRDRGQAGRLLAEEVAKAGPVAPVVLALPRGGVPVANEISVSLDCPLDVLVARKLGVPWQPELGMGAIAEGEVKVLNADLIKRLRLTEDEVETVRKLEDVELRRRAGVYRSGGERLPVTGATAIIVDDGLATGFTAAAGVASARRAGADQVWMAVPVGPPDTVDWLGELADNIICPLMPRFFEAVGMWYDDFDQTTDDEVVGLLEARR